MTLDEYRAYIVQKLSVCKNPALVPDVLAETEVMLAATKVTPLAQERLWQGIRSDLEVLRQRSLQLDPDAGELLRSVIAAARWGIANYQRLLSK